MGRTIKRVNMAAVRPAEKAKRVAAYARVSCGKDAMLHSLSAQVSYYSGLIQKTPGWEYAGVYADEAVSGTKNSRGEFQKMLAECRAGNIDLIITKSISRFARNTVTTLKTIRELRLIGVDVYFEEQNIHAQKAMDQAEYERKYNGYCERYEAARVRLAEIGELRLGRIAKRTKISMFLKELASREGLVAEFDEELWYATVDHVAVYEDKRMVFTFRDGTEVTIKKGAWEAA